MFSSLVRDALSTRPAARALPNAVPQDAPEPAVAGAAAPALAVAEARAPREPGVGRGTPGVPRGPHAPIRRLRIARGAMKHQYVLAAAKLAAVESAVAPPLANRCSNVAFGSGSFTSATSLVMVDGVAVDMPVKSKDEALGLRDRGLLSHLQAQGGGVAEFVQSGDVDMLGSLVTYDDASMWVRRPNKRRQHDAADPDARKAARKGVNVHVPVLNSCETLFTVACSTGPSLARADASVSSPLARADGPDALVEMDDTRTFVARAADVFSPCRVLPVANSPTVHDRLSKWTVLSAAGVGAKV